MRNRVKDKMNEERNERNEKKKKRKDVKYERREGERQKVRIGWRVGEVVPNQSES